MVRRAENCHGSSAKGHCGLEADAVLTKSAYWNRQFGSVGDWSGWLAEGDDREEMEILRRNVNKNLPCGSARFIRKLEGKSGRVLQYRPRGRPKTDNEAGKG